MRSLMQLNELVNRVFSADKNIRYVGIIKRGPKFDLLESRMREGMKSLTPDKTDREFSEIIPQIILGAAERLENDLGRITYSLIGYEKLSLVFFKTPKYTVILSVEAGIPVTPIYERVRSLLELEQ